MTTILADILDRFPDELLNDWLRFQAQGAVSERHRISESQLRTNSQEFLKAIREALATASGTNVNSDEWAPVCGFLAELSRQRAAQGFSPAETANFVFSFKQAVFLRLQSEFKTDSAAVIQGVMQATDLLDKLGLQTIEVYQKSREEVILRQQQEMLELSTPVVELWKGILALPLIGTLDSQRTQVVMQNLLEAIVASDSDLAIVDITGVPTVDTLVAQHLLKTVAAARLMGADCIISGIRPQIAQTIVHLGVDLGNVQTKATLAGAFQLALCQKGLVVAKG